MSSKEKDKNSSRDSGMGLLDSDTETHSPCKTSNGFQRTHGETSDQPNTKQSKNEIGLGLTNVNGNKQELKPSVTVNKTISGTLPIPLTVTVCSDIGLSGKPKGSKTFMKSVSDDRTHLKSFLTVDNMAPQTRQRSVSDVRHQASHVRIFQLKYFGERTLDKRVTQPMIPWIVDEMCQNKATTCDILLQISRKGVLGISEGKGSIMFEHRLHNVCRFSRGHKVNCFTYQWRTDVENSKTKLFAFEAAESSLIDNISDNIKNTTKTALQMDAGGSDFSREVGLSVLEELKDNNCTMFEVLYCGRISTSHKRAPPSLIDDAVDKFKEHEKDLKSRMLESSKKRHFSCEDQLDKIGDSNSIKSLDPKMSKSVDELGGDDKMSSCSRNSSDSCSNGSGHGSGHCDNDVHPQDRERAGSGASTSSDGPRLEKRILARQDTFTELVTAKEKTHNRTMVFQIGRTALTLISTDNKSFALTKKFTEISYCSQGIKYPEYFGFICRENLEISNQFRCYVFRVQDEATVDVIMATLKQSFAAALQESKNNVVCETCPMHKFHKLCLGINDKSPESALTCIRQHVESLSEGQRHSLASMLRSSSPGNQQEQNQLIMNFLRNAYEKQQVSHAHISNDGIPVSAFASQSSPSKPQTTPTQEGPFRKAKKSLASSFESLLSRNRNKNSSSNSSTPEMPRRGKSPIEPSQENSSPLMNKNNVETSPYEDSCTPLSENHITASPDVSTSPLVGSSGPTTSTPASAKSIQPPTSLSLGTSTSTIPESPVYRRVSHDLEDTKTLQEEPRRRSKTLGDEPASPPTPVNNQRNHFEFVTPKDRKALHRRSMPPPLTRAMSVDLDASSFSRYPLTTPKRKMSFRQQIFNRVVTTPLSEKKTFVDIVEEIEDVFQRRDESCDLKAQEKRRTHIRGLWKRAIHEQILLIRMEKMNRHMEKASKDAVSEKQRKLGYEEITPCLKEVANQWDGLLKQDEDVFHDPEKVNSLFKQGIPRHRCGAIWKFLIKHMKRKSPSSIFPIPDHEPYAELLKQLTTHQHAILIDLGRTYPNHSHFSHPLGRGQLSLFNLLKAYSLLDVEVGYCQGLSFVAGFILIHLEEKEAFEMLVYLMHGLGFRRQYKADMMALQIHMYQLSRLLHDHHRELHDHLEQNEVSPSLYAAPWFLTFFASQFPLGFIARIFDMVFLQGADVIFKVALVILASHREKLLECDGFEAIITYLKDVVPNVNFVELEKIISQAYSLDVARQLQAYEVEYHVIQEEMLPSPMHTSRSMSSDLDQMEIANRNLRRHNEELLEQMQTARNTMYNLETTVQALQDNEIQLKSKLRSRTNERLILLNTITKLKDLIPKDVMESNGINPKDIENILSGAADSNYHRSRSLPSFYDNGNPNTNGPNQCQRMSSSTSDDSVTSGISNRSGWVVIEHEVLL